MANYLDSLSVIDSANEEHEVLLQDRGTLAIANANSLHIGDLDQLKTSDKSSLVASINSIVDDYVSPEDYGAIGDGITDDTDAVQDAFDSGKNVLFKNNYAVTSVIFNGHEKMVDFHGFKLIGISTTDDFVMVIDSAMYNHFKNINIECTSTSAGYYYGCLQIKSSLATQSQFNIFENMRFTLAYHGLVWGAKENETSIENAQSETVIYNLITRSVAFPVLGNQLNGYLSLIGSQIDTNLYEQWPDNRFTENDCVGIKNLVGTIAIYDSTIECTRNENQYGFYGENIYCYDCSIEVAGTVAFITGNFELNDFYNGFSGSQTKTLFIVNNGANGVVKIGGGKFHRADNPVNKKFMYGYDAPLTKVFLYDLSIECTNFDTDLFGNLDVQCNNVRLPHLNILLNDHDIVGWGSIDNNSTDVNTFVYNEFSLTPSFNSTSGIRGIGVNFGSTSWQSILSDFIPVYGGTLFHDNHKMVSVGVAYLYLDCFDESKTIIESILIQTSDEGLLNRSSLRYLPTGTKYVQYRITNGNNTDNVYVIVADARLTGAYRGGEANV